MFGRVGIKIPPPWYTNANANANIQNWKEGWFIKIKQIDKLFIMFYCNGISISC